LDQGKGKDHINLVLKFKWSKTII